MRRIEAGTESAAFAGAAEWTRGAATEAASALAGFGFMSQLDPADWEAYRRGVHALVDEALDYLAEVRSRPVWQPLPDDLKAFFQQPLPRTPRSLDDVGGDVVAKMFPYATGNIHPRFFGWVNGGGTAGGMVAELLAAAMNANCGGRDHVAVYVERQIVEWFRDLFHWPRSTSGVLVTGTSAGTLTALAVARDRATGFRSGDDGVSQDQRPLVAYTSSETHSSVVKAFKLLGLGQKHLRKVPVDAHYKLSPAALEAAVLRDVAAGVHPFCVCATAGTVNTGAFDDLAGLAAVCRKYSLWMHVDGAFGALAALSESLRPRLDGLDLADSVAFDFHKWMQTPYDVGCVLVRDGAAHQRTFANRGDYLTSLSEGLAGGRPWFGDFGLELSRGFRALKVWFTLQEHGADRLGAMIEGCCRLAAQAAEEVGRRPQLELLAPTTLNILCFRYRAEGLSEPQLDRLNERIVTELQTSGVAAPSATRLGGKLAIRACVVNHRTEPADLQLLIEEVLSLGGRLHEELLAEST